MAGRTRAVACSSQRWSELEASHVHSVYDRIAPCLPTLPQKAWPKVKQFLKELPPGSLLADIGCGNGRYLDINPSIFKLGSDTCVPLLSQAQQQGFHTLLADNLRLPFRDSLFDAAISIGVIHHFATGKRRIQALTELARILRVGGRVMIYVWAFEQKHRKFESQDILVPWHKSQKVGHKRHRSTSSDYDRSSTSSLSDDDSASLYSFDNLSREPSIASLEASSGSTPLSREESREREGGSESAVPSQQQECPANSKAQREQLWSECQKLEECLRQLSAQQDEKEVTIPKGKASSAQVSPTKRLGVPEPKKTLPFRPQSLPIASVCQPSQVSAESQLQWASTLPMKKSLSHQDARDSQETHSHTSSVSKEGDDGFFRWLKKRFHNLFSSGNKNEPGNKAKSAEASHAMQEGPPAWFAVREFPQSSLREGEDKPLQQSTPAGHGSRPSNYVDRAVQTCSPENLSHSKFAFQSPSRKGFVQGGWVHKSLSDPTIKSKSTAHLSGDRLQALAPISALRGGKAGLSKPLSDSSSLQNGKSGHKSGSKQAVVAASAAAALAQLSQKHTAGHIKSESNGDDAFHSDKVEADPTEPSFMSEPGTCSLGHCKKILYPDSSRQRCSQEETVHQRSRFSSLPHSSSLPRSAPTERRGRKRAESDSALISKEDAGSSPDLCRYYHVFKEKELDHLILEHVPSLRILDSYYDHANWCLVAEKITT